MIDTKEIMFDHTRIRYSMININSSPICKLKYITRHIAGLIKKNNFPIDKIAVIDYFRVDPEFRNKGYGRNAMDMLISTIKIKGYGKVILLQSDPLIDADHGMQPTGKDLDKVLFEQAAFFEMCGFRNINSLCNFDTSIPYLYLDDESKSVFKEILKMEFKLE